MCDTMAVMPGYTRDGSLLFAKNSDREPNEPHIMVRVPRRRLKAGDSISCTYISVVNHEEKELLTNSAILFKPSWIWGAEMGVNEKGLVIGNEAVFTKEKVNDKGLLGMDMLRLALELCGNAREALDYIAALTESYGQGGKAGYTQNLKYHNSYIIADFKEAYVLETAGRHWAFERIRDIRSISNTLSIGSEFEGCSSQLVEHALAKGWCRNRNEFDFKKCYESRLHPHFTKGYARRMTAEEYLRSKQGLLDVADMKAILRSHGRKHKVEGFKSGSMECICMHAGGGLITSQTTGSLIVKLKDESISIWATCSSIPCISVFKPIWFNSLQEGFFTEGNRDGLVEYWKDIERFHRKVLGGNIKCLDVFVNRRNELEKELEALAGQAGNDETREEITRYAISKEKEIINDILKHEAGQLNKKERARQGSAYYRMYWDTQNRSL